MWPQMMHTLLPGGLMLHADAPRMFADQLLTQGTLSLIKVNMDAASTAKRLEVSAYSQHRPAVCGCSGSMPVHCCCSYAHHVTVAS